MVIQFLRLTCSNTKFNSNVSVSDNQPCKPTGPIELNFKIEVTDATKKLIGIFIFAIYYYVPR